MIIAFKTAHGYLSFQPPPDGQNGPVTVEYRQIAAPEAYEKVELEGFTFPDPPPITQPPVQPPVIPPPQNGSNRDYFMACVSDKIQNWAVPDQIPIAQNALLDLFDPTRDGRLLSAGWSLTPPNHEGDRTKVKPLNGPWTRVGFGEGHWVWLEQAG